MRRMWDHQTKGISMNLGALLSVVLFVVFSGCATTQRLPEKMDFAARCQVAVAIRCIGFDSAEAIDPYVHPPWGQTVKRAMVVHDIRASGAGSLRFEVPSNSGSDSSGSFWMNFSDDLSVQFGEGDEFYVQWRQRFSKEFSERNFQGGGGWKQFIVGEGDRPGFRADSCTQIELVVSNPYYQGAPGMYHSCGGKDGDFEGLYASASIGYAPDEWMTFQLHVKIGTWYKNDRVYHQDSTVQLWVGREGQRSKLVVDLSPEPATLFGLALPGSGTGYDLANRDAVAKYGKLWLLPYNTHKDPSESHPTSYTWYDDLIVARKKIPDPY